MKELFESKNLIISEHYINRYIKFVMNYKNHPQIKYKTESHHILPKIYFPEYDNDILFRVNLPKRAHYIAHYMLALAIGGKMWHAFQLMGRIKKHKSRHYEMFSIQASIENSRPEKIEKISNSVKKLWENDEYRNQQIQKKKGKPNTESQKKKISESLKGKSKPDGFRIGCKHSMETKKKLSDAKKGIKNPSNKPITIYDNNNIPVLTILYKFKDVCIELGFPTSLYDTYKNNTKLYDYNMRKCDVSRLTNEGKYQYKGWYARYSK